MIQFLFDNNEDIPNLFIDRNRYTPKKVQLPFDQSLKRKVVVRPNKGNPKFLRVYVKGAPENVLPMCIKTLGKDLIPLELSNNEKVNILN